MPNEKIKIILSNQERNARLKDWLKQNKLTLATLATGMGLSPMALSYHCNRSTIPVYQHSYLIAQGIPEDLIPKPLDQRPGPKPKRLSA